MMRWSGKFGTELQYHGIDLEAAIKGCKEITLDYSWYAKFPNGGYTLRKYIALYVDSKQVARIFLEKDGRDSIEGVEDILTRAYKSLRKAVRINRLKVKVRGTYLKGHLDQEQDLGSLR